MDAAIIALLVVADLILVAKFAFPSSRRKD